MMNLLLPIVAVPLSIFLAVYVGVLTGYISDEQGNRPGWRGFRIEIGETVRYIIGAMLLALAPVIVTID